MGLGWALMGFQACTQCAGEFGEFGPSAVQWDGGWESAVNAGAEQWVGPQATAAQLPLSFSSFSLVGNRGWPFYCGGHGGSRPSRGAAPRPRRRPTPIPFL